MKSQRLSISILSLVTGVLFCASWSEARSEVEIIAVYYKKEIIDEHVFSYREDDVNGVVKRAWLVDDKPVDESEYSQALVEVQMRERMQERKKEQEMHNRATRAKRQAVYGLHKKILDRHMHKLSLWKKKIEDPRIISFYSFKPKTFATEKDLYDVFQDLLDRARTLSQEDVSACDLGEMQKMGLSLEMAQVRLQDFFYDTVNTAIQKCDDTKVLKDLLEIVA